MGLFLSSGVMTVAEDKKWLIFVYTVGDGQLWLEAYRVGTMPEEELLACIPGYAPLLAPSEFIMAPSRNQA